MPRDFELHKHIDLIATPEQVWEAIATGPGLAAWFMPMPVPPPGGELTAWDPPHRLAIRTDGPTQAFEYLIEAREGGSTTLRLVHSGVLGDDWGDEYEDMTSGGWDMYLHTLAQYLRHFAGRPAVYIEAEAGGSPPTAGSIPRLAAALGLDGTVAEGDRVRAEIGGLGTLDGVVDYVAAAFLGIRTPDALVRFHDRAQIGMPVAVSEHRYTTEADPAGAAGAWRRWLAGALT